MSTVVTVIEDAQIVRNAVTTLQEPWQTNAVVLIEMVERHSGGTVAFWPLWTGVGCRLGLYTAAGTLVTTSIYPGCPDLYSAVVSLAAKCTDLAAWSDAFDDEYRKWADRTWKDRDSA